MLGDEEIGLAQQIEHRALPPGIARKAPVARGGGGLRRRRAVLRIEEMAPERTGFGKEIGLRAGERLRIGRRQIERGHRAERRHQAAHALRLPGGMLHKQLLRAAEHARPMLHLCETDAALRLPAVHLLLDRHVSLRVLANTA